MIRFLNIKKINQVYEAEFTKKMQKVLESGWLLLGEESKNLENEIAKYHQVDAAINTGSGLDALTIIFRSMMVLGLLKKGDEVLVPSNTFIASAMAISYCGLVPKLVEPSPETFLIDDKIEKDISENTKAILPVHLYGRMCDMKPLIALAEKYGLYIIEDNAQAIGAELNGKKSGTFGIAGALSFYPGKNLGALSDGGAIITNLSELAQVARQLRNYGSSKKYHHDLLGFNSRLDEIQCSFLNIKLPFLDKDNQKRKDIAKKYCDEIKNPFVLTPAYVEENVWHLYVLKVLDGHRDLLQSYLHQNGVETLIHYPIPIHKQKAYKDLNAISLPIAENLSQEVLSIPISPVMTEQEVEHIIQVLNAFTL